MALMRCIKRLWDSKREILYYPGDIQDLDPKEEAAQVDSKGKGVFFVLVDEPKKDIPPIKVEPEREPEKEPEEVLKRGPGRPPMR